MNKKIIDWYRVKRTAIQAIAGGLATFLASIVNAPTVDAIRNGAIGFAVTVVTAICMNIEKQVKSIPDEEGENHDE